MQYRQVRRTVTQQELVNIIYEWTHEGAELYQTNLDGDGNLTGAVIIDHGQCIHALYTVGLVSDKPEPYISKEERALQEAISRAYAKAGQVPAIQVREIHSKGKFACWEVSIPSYGWQPALPYGYCYTVWQLLNAVEDALVFYQNITSSPRAGF